MTVAARLVSDLPTCALLIICHNRPDELRHALASAEQESFDETVVLDMASSPPVAPIAGVRWLREEANVGCAAGRNILAEASTAEVLFFLDDDAVLQTPGTRETLAQLFADDDRLGAVACRIVRPGGNTVPHEHPFRGAPADATTPRPGAYFVGAGHAVRRSAWMDAGGLDDRYFYSTEEVDLALALVRRGYRIWYAADVVIEHRPSPHGRSSDSQIPAMRIRNRVLLARRHLPVPVAIVHIVIWAARTLREAVRARGIRRWSRSLVDGMRMDVERDPLPWSSVATVHRLGGRAWW